MAVRTALGELEQYASTRVRSSKDAECGKDRSTKNIVAACFTHETSRSVAEGVPPDPLLHTHATVFNCTKTEEGWRALQTLGMHQAQGYASAAYDHALIGQLTQMGYQIRETANGWELANIADSTVEKFSKRRKAILERTAELEAAGAKRGHHELKSAVAHDERIRKQGPQSAAELQKSWMREMDSVDRLGGMLGQIHPDHTQDNIYSASRFGSAAEALAWAKSHVFERQCVVREPALLAEALRKSRASGWSLEELKNASASDPELLRETGTTRITTEAALEREKYILRVIESGKNQFAPLAPGLLDSASVLSPEQRQAAEQIISSRDSHTLFRVSQVPENHSHWSM